MSQAPPLATRHSAPSSWASASLAQPGAKVIALSADDKDTSRELMSEDDLRYPAWRGR